jgi:hypothetical protein
MTVFIGLVGIGTNLAASVLYFLLPAEARFDPRVVATGDFSPASFPESVTPQTSCWQ